MSTKDRGCKFAQLNQERTPVCQWSFAYQTEVRYYGLRCIQTHCKMIIEALWDGIIGYKRTRQKINSSGKNLDISVWVYFIFGGRGTDKF